MTKRIYRKLSEAEATRMSDLRKKIDTEEKEEILEMARQAKRQADALRGRLKEVFLQLKQERQKRGLSLSDMSQRTGMAPDALSRLENMINDNPKIDTIQRYADSLGMVVEFHLVDAK
jgi:DNA-binding XRE family transcriptional regulator